MQYKDIAGYEGRYYVSDAGEVFAYASQHWTMGRFGMMLRHTKARQLKPWKRSTYLLVDLWKDGKRDVRSVHYLVWETFNDMKVPNGCVIHHKDHNKYNNSLDNLQMMSMLEHNRLHCCGRTSWNKGKKMPPEVYQKMWETRRRKQQQNKE